MKQLLSSCLLAVGLFVGTVRGQTVLTFDDLNPGGGVIAMPAGYGGLNWATNLGVWGATQNPYNPQSPPNRVLFNYNLEFGVAETLVTFIGSPKVFDGAYFSGGSTVQFNLYNGPTLVGTSGILSLSSTPTFLASGYAGAVTTVGIIGNRGGFAMDNFTFEPVPEPATLSLGFIGIVALGLRCCHRSKACNRL